MVLFELADSAYASAIMAVARERSWSTSARKASEYQ
jgi:hypothetical protein